MAAGNAMHNPNYVALDSGIVEEIQGSVTTSRYIKICTGEGTVGFPAQTSIVEELRRGDPVVFVYVPVIEGGVEASELQEVQTSNRTILRLATIGVG